MCFGRRVVHGNHDKVFSQMNDLFRRLAESAAIAFLISVALSVCAGAIVMWLVCRKF